MYVVDAEITNGKEDVSRRNNIDVSDPPQYEQLKNQSLNPGPTYERLTPSTNVDATEQDFSDRPTYEDIGYTSVASRGSLMPGVKPIF